MQIIVAKGLLSTLKDLLNNLSSGWSAILKHLDLDKTDSFLEVKDVKKNKDGDVTEAVFNRPMVGRNGVEEVKMAVSYSEDGETAYIQFYENGKPTEKKSVKNDRPYIEKVLQDWEKSLKEKYDEEKEQYDKEHPEESGNSEKVYQYIIEDPKDKSKYRTFDIQVTAISDDVVEIETFMDKKSNSDKIQVANDADVIKKNVDQIVENFKEQFGSNFKQVKSCKSLKFVVARTPITGSKQDSIDLLSINANYELGAAIENMGSIMDSEEVLSLLPNTGVPQVIDVICPDCLDDAYQVTVDECSQDIECKDSLEQLIAELIVMENNLRTISWNISGEDFQQIKCLCEDIAYSVGYDINRLGELFYNKYSVVPNPLTLNSMYFDQLVSGEMPITVQEAVSYLNSMISDYLMVLSTVYVNFGVEYQQFFSEAISKYQQKQSDIKRMFIQI